jgi:hypothetical protein
LLWGRESTLLRKYAPVGTAMVQLIRNDEDKDAVCCYLTKTWRHSAVALAARKTVSASDELFDFRELSEYFSPEGTRNPARRIKIDPVTGAHVLDLDDPHPWRRRGKKIRS